MYNTWRNSIEHIARVNQITVFETFVLLYSYKCEIAWQSNPLSWFNYSVQVLHMNSYVKLLVLLSTRNKKWRELCQKFLQIKKDAVFSFFRPNNDNDESRNIKSPRWLNSSVKCFVKIYIILVIYFWETKYRELIHTVVKVFVICIHYETNWYISEQTLNR